MAEEIRRRRKLAAIMMADVSGFSRLMGEDEESTVALIEAFHTRVRARVELHEGRVVDTAGDSVFGEFDSVVNAMEAANEIQAEQAGLNAIRSGPPIETRIGVHVGDVIVEGDRVYGDGVNIAARLEGQSEPGGICVSEAVYQQVHKRVAIPFRELGERELKNIDEPIRLYAVEAKAVVPIEPMVLPEVAVRTIAEEPAPTRSASGKRLRPSRTRKVKKTSWSLELMKPGTLTLMIACGLLVGSSLLLVSTAGLFEFAGAVGFGAIFGRVATKVHRREGLVLFAIGVAIASGAIWTQWSPVADRFFIAAGLVTAALGLPAFARSGRPPKP